MLDVWMVALIGALGLVAGVSGGMLGIGGSTIMIPGLVLLFGQMERPGFNQHLYQAAAMIVNVGVAVPATWRHVQAGAIVPRVIKYMLPAALVTILIGVWASNLPIFTGGGLGVSGPVLLGRVMAAFMVYVILANVRKMFRKPRATDAPLVLTHVTRPRCTVVGGAMGFVAGLLGVGGGAVAVPLQQVFLKLRLRNCIANSAAIMCITAVFGAIYKNVTLSQHNVAVSDSLLIAVLLAPTAIIGGAIGGRLTHVLPVRVVRGAFIILLAAAAWKMAAV